jgi:hypothetical protein
MKAQTKTKTKTAMFGGAAALAPTVGFGGIGVHAATSAPTTTAHTSSSAALAAPNAATSGSADGVHVATLTSCIAGLDC